MLQLRSALVFAGALLCSVFAFANEIGSYSITEAAGQCCTTSVSSYDDNGALLSQRLFGDSEFYDYTVTLTTNTIFVSSTALTNALSRTVPSATLITENFNAPIDLSYRDGLYSFGCAQPQFNNGKADCGPLPGSPGSTLPTSLPLTASANGTSLSGAVGDCSGYPRCIESTGWEPAYALEMHFSHPVYAIAADTLEGADFSANDFFQTLFNPADLDPNLGSGPRQGWIFPEGISDITVNLTPSPSCPHCGLFGPEPFVLSNLEIAVITPEPRALVLVGSGLAALSLFSCRSSSKARQC